MTNENEMIQYGCQGLLSEEMEKYMEQHICQETAIEIIAGAPISLIEKENRLKKLKSNTKKPYIREGIDSCVEHIEAALSELENMTKDSFIISESCWYDIQDGSTLDYINRSTEIPPCNSFAELKEAILDEIEDNIQVRDYDAFETVWHEFVIWNKKQYPSGQIKMEQGHYRYIMIGPDICYIESSELIHWKRYSADNWKYLSGSSNLNLPVPFKAGDIVTVDCRPFAEVEHLLILNTESNWDCCGLRGAFADEDGKLHIDSVKHSHCFPMKYQSRLSPLYRMSLNTGPLPENETVIKQIHLDMKRYEEQNRENYGRIFEDIATRWTMFDEGYLNKILCMESIRRR